jgi:SOS-response transcriptional repressor LexA
MGTLAEIERRTSGEVTASYLSQVKNGYREMGDKTARSLESALNKPSGWMDWQHAVANIVVTEKGVVTAAGREIGEVGKHEGPNVEEIRQPGARLPLISWVRAGLRDNVFDPYAPGAAEAFIDFESRASSSAFCLRVRGDSMLRPDGTGFPDGCLIAVEPRKIAKSMDFVVVRFENTDEATFKQLILDGPLKMLRPLNPSYPSMAMSPDAHISGVVIEKRIIERFY